MPAFANIQEEIAAMLDIADEDLTEEQREAMDAYLNDLADQEASKVDAFAAFLRQESARADACKTEAQRLYARARSVERRIGYLKDRYLGIMQEHGLKRVAGNAYAISVRISRAVEVTDMSAIPAEYRREKVEVTADKAALKEALAGGAVIPGCSLMERPSLQVR